MVLVDTSVWVDFLREGNPLLTDLLNEGSVLTHPFVVGELRLGNIPKRAHFLGLLENLPQAVPASDAEVTHLIEMHKLYGKGIGYIDAHLHPGSARPRCGPWTSDWMPKKLKVSSS